MDNKTISQQNTLEQDAKFVQKQIYECETAITFIIKSAEHTFNKECLSLHIPDMLVSMLSPVRAAIKNIREQRITDLRI